MYNEKLDRLMANGTIKSYSIVDMDENGVEGRRGQFRNTERLRLQFPDGQELIVDTFCSGCSEHTTLSFT